MKPLRIAALALGLSFATLGTAQATVIGTFTTTLPQDNYTEPTSASPHRDQVDATGNSKA